MELDKIGVYIICYNEEKSIRNSLESVKWADEIIIVDSGSNDKTVEICKEYTDKIYFKEFKGFGEQKNYAKSLITKEWALNLDADEVISRELLIELTNLEISNGVNGFCIPRRNYYIGKAIKRCGWYPDYKLRLHRSKEGKWKDVLVHESYIVEGQVRYLQNPILHYTYDSVSKHIEKINIYAKYGAEMIVRRNKRIYMWHMILVPLGTFIKKYIVQLGILEGYRGILISCLESYSSMLKYAIAYENKIIRRGK